MAPISLAILNPMGFVLMEIGKRRVLNDEPLLSINSDSFSNSVVMAKTQCRMFASVAKSIFFNPIVAMTILGVLGNLVFQHNVPTYLAGILDVRKTTMCLIIS